MDTWFQAATTYFGLFYDVKLELYQEAVESLRSADADAGGGGMTEFMKCAQIDCADFEYVSNTDKAKKNGEADDDDEVGNMNIAGVNCDDAVIDVLRHAYKGVPSGFTAEVQEDEKASTATLYGELTSRGVRQLYSLIQEECARLQPQAYQQQETDETDDETVKTDVIDIDFVDLGSGGGRVCIELALLAAARAKATDESCENNTTASSLAPLLPVLRCTDTSSALSFHTLPPQTAETRPTKTQIVSRKRPNLRFHSVSGIEYCQGRWDSSRLALSRLSERAQQEQNEKAKEKEKDQRSTSCCFLDKLPARTEFHRGDLLQAADMLQFDTADTADNTDNGEAEGQITATARSVRPLVFFCCGVAFDLPFVTQMCDMVHSMGKGGGGGGGRRPVVCVFLLVHVPEDHALFREHFDNNIKKQNKETTENSDTNSHVVAKTAGNEYEYSVRQSVLEATWMEKHPAWVISQKCE